MKTRIYFKPGEAILFDDLKEATPIDKYVVTEVYKTGEKTYRKRGPRPQGYNVYKNGLYSHTLLYGEKPMWLVKK